MKPFDEITKAILLDDNDEPISAEENNQQAVNELMRDTVTEWEYRIARLKDDLTEEWQPGQRERIEALHEAYRLAWEHLRQSGAADQ